MKNATLTIFFDDGKLNETRCIASSAPQFDKNNFSFLSIFMSHNHWTMHGNSLCDACIRWLWLQLLVRSMLSIVLMRFFGRIDCLGCCVSREWMDCYSYVWLEQWRVLFVRSVFAICEWFGIDKVSMMMTFRWNCSYLEMSASKDILFFLFSSLWRWIPPGR